MFVWKNEFKRNDYFLNSPIFIFLNRRSNDKKNVQNVHSTETWKLCNSRRCKVNFTTLDDKTINLHENQVDLISGNHSRGSEGFDMIAPNDRNRLERLESGIKGIIRWHMSESVGPFSGNDRRTLQSTDEPEIDNKRPFT